jgi:Holliday junction resolvase RusA-like endonuclease
VKPFTCVILGDAATKKNRPRLIRVKGRTIPIPCKEYMTWEKISVLQLNIARSELGAWKRDCVFPNEPVEVEAVFYRTNRRPDLVNLYQALSDILEKARIVHNDRQIVCWSGGPIIVDKDKPRVEITVSQYADPGEAIA